MKQDSKKLQVVLGAFFAGAVVGGLMVAGMTRGRSEQQQPAEAVATENMQMRATFSQSSQNAPAAEPSCEATQEAMPAPACPEAPPSPGVTFSFDVQEAQAEAKRAEQEARDAADSARQEAQEAADTAQQQARELEQQAREFRNQMQKAQAQWEPLNTRSVPRAR